MKIKKIILLTFVLVFGLTSLKTTSDAKKIEDIVYKIENECDSLVADAFSFFESSGAVKNKLLRNAINDGAQNTKDYNYALSNAYNSLPKDIFENPSRYVENPKDLDFLLNYYNKQLGDYNTNVDSFLETQNSRQLAYRINVYSAALTISSILSLMISCCSTAITSSWVPWVGWAIAAVAILVLIVIIVDNWEIIRNNLENLKNNLISTFPRIQNLINTTFAQASDKAKEDKPDFADDATSQNQMQKQVEKGQAPKEVDRVDKGHTSGQQDHVHFKDGTSINKDGTANLTKKILDWLQENGWCLNGQH